MKPGEIDEDEAQHILLCLTNEGDLYRSSLEIVRANSSDSEWGDYVRAYTKRLLREKRIDAWPSAATIGHAAALIRDYYIRHSNEQ